MNTSLVVIDTCILQSNNSIILNEKQAKRTVKVVAPPQPSTLLSKTPFLYSQTAIAIKKDIPFLHENKRICVPSYE